MKYKRGFILTNETKFSAFLLKMNCIYCTQVYLNRILQVQLSTISRNRVPSSIIGSRGVAPLETSCIDKKTMSINEL